jgi:hypothetical protein
MHRAVLDAVIARNPAKAERAVMVLIEGARQDIEQVLASRRKLPVVSGVATPIKSKARPHQPAAKKAVKKAVKTVA